MSPELKGVIIGSLISSVVLIANTIIQSVSAHKQRKVDENIKYREALFKMAFDHWHAESLRVSVPLPLEHYLIRMDTLHTLFIEDEPSTEKIEAKLKAFMLSQNQLTKYLNAVSNQ